LTGRANKLTTVLLAVAIGIGSASLLVSWFIADRGDGKYAVLEERVEQVSANLAGFEDAFKRLSTEIRQLHTAVSAVAADSGGDRPVQVPDRISAVDMDGPVSSGDGGAPSPGPTTAADMPTEQEMASVTLIVDKLRAHDVYSYPDFPSLMSSSEMVDLGPAAKDLVMAEIARMVERNEIDPYFFPR